MLTMIGICAVLALIPIISWKLSSYGLKLDFGRSFLTFLLENSKETIDSLKKLSNQQLIDLAVDVDLDIAFSIKNKNGYLLQKKTIYRTWISLEIIQRGYDRRFSK